MSNIYWELSLLTFSGIDSNSFCVNITAFKKWCAEWVKIILLFTESKEKEVLFFCNKNQLLLFCQKLHGDNLGSVSVPGSSQLLLCSSCVGSAHPGTGWWFSDSHQLPRSSQLPTSYSNLGLLLNSTCHLHPASESIIFQSLPVFISLCSFILKAVYLNGHFLRFLALVQSMAVM